jgi:hypothetical protein
MFMKEKIDFCVLMIDFPSDPLKRMRKHARLIRRGCVSRLDQKLVTYLRGAPNKSIELFQSKTIE